MRNRKKTCYICNQEKEILYRCRYKENFIKRDRVYERWVFICKHCLDNIKEKYKNSYQYGGPGKVGKNSHLLKIRKYCSNFLRLKKLIQK